MREGLTCWQECLRSTKEGNESMTGEGEDSTDSND